jgi:hypothetical protein
MVRKVDRSEKRRGYREEATMTTHSADQELNSLAEELAKAASVKPDDAMRVLKTLGAPNLIKQAHALGGARKNPIKHLTLQNVRIGVRGHAFNFPDLVA